MCAMMEKLRMNSRSMRYDCAVGASVTCLHRLSHMSYSNIRFEVGDFGLALLTVNRPEKLNALNAETVLELRDAVARAATDAEVRALIVTGAGEKAFVAGADINQLAVLTPIEAQAYAERGQRVFREIEMLAKPTLNAETVLELRDAVARAATDAEVRALIVTGAGEKAFVAGADINQLAVLTPIEAQAG